MRFLRRLSSLLLLLHATISIAFVILPKVSHAPIYTLSLSAKSGKKKKKPKDSTIALNRQAYRNYEIIDTLEAGISLLGTEVKSIRDGKMNLRDGYVKASKDGRGCMLFNVHISKHRFSGEYF